MAILYDILYWVNWIFIGITSLGLVIQVFFILLCWLPRRRFKKAEVQHKYAIIIPACNEADVIENTVKELLEKQTYPKELYDVFVCADNCKDNTAELARNAGAIVYERFDDDPSHKRAAFPIKHIIDIIMKEHTGKYDAIIKLDADNLVNPEYMEVMNDAYDSGVRIGRSYEASTNLYQNIWTQVSGLYYIRDSRIACHVREQLHGDQMLSGAGLMIGMEVLESTNGWDAMGYSDDSEYTCLRLQESDPIIKKNGKKMWFWRKRRFKTRYVEDAIVYEDQPATLKDTFNRLSRMAYGINKNFWKYSPKMLLTGLRTRSLVQADMVCTMLFIIISFIACCWFIPYYVFYIIINGLLAFPDVFNSFGLIPMMQGSLYIYPTGITDVITGAQANLNSLMQMIIMVVVVFLVAFSLQSFLAAALDRKKLGLKLHKLIFGFILSPIFMLLYAVAVCIGIFRTPKRKKVARNKAKV